MEIRIWGALWKSRAFLTFIVIVLYIVTLILFLYVNTPSSYDMSNTDGLCGKYLFWENSIAPFKSLL